jgi:Predicted membrane protein (DUF2154).
MDQRKNRHLRLGILLIVIGVIIILHRFALIPFGITDILFSWQMILVIIGTIMLVNKNSTSGYILVAIGIFCLIPDLFQFTAEFKKIFWPSLLIIIGLILVLNSVYKSRIELKDMTSKDLDQFDDFIFLGGRDTLINSQNFKIGRSVAVLGGIEYDFRQAQLSPDIVVVDCTCVMGSICFKVPPDWTIKNEVTAVMGAFTDQRSDSFLKVNTDLTKVIIVTGTVVLGGIVVKFM